MLPSPVASSIPPRKHYFACAARITDTTIHVARCSSKRLPARSKAHCPLRILLNRYHQYRVTLSRASRPSFFEVPSFPLLLLAVCRLCFSRSFVALVGCAKLVLSCLSLREFKRYTYNVSSSLDIRSVVRSDPSSGYHDPCGIDQRPASWRCSQSSLSATQQPT